MKVKLALQREHSSAIDVIAETDATALVADLVRELVDTDPTRTGDRGDPDELTLAASPPGMNAFRVLDPDQALDDAQLGSGWDARLVRRGSSTPDHGRSAGPAANLRVLAGPDSGRTFPLRAGPNVVGRDQAADVVLNDPMVSRRHARIDVGGSVEIVDLNSANGIEVDGGLVTRATVTAGQVVTIGDSRITVDVSFTPAAIAAPQAELQGGARPVVRSPVVEPRYPFTEHARPEIPGEIDKPPFPWLLMLVPVVVGAVAFAFTLNPLSLLFVAMSPLMLASNYVMARIRNTRRLGNQIARFDKQLAALDARLTAEQPRERQVRNDEAPTTTRVVDGARQLNQMLWTRRPEHWNFLHLRLGTGSAPSRNTVAAAGDRADGLPELEDRLTEVIQRHRVIEGVPIVESLAACGALGIAGPQNVATPTVQALLAQLTCLHSPAEVVVAAIGGSQTAHDLEWLKWTPHTSAAQSPLSGSHLASGSASATDLLSQLEELVDHRLAANGEQQRGPLAAELAATAHGGRVGADEQPPPSCPLPAVVLVIGPDAPVNQARAVQLAERAPDAGVFTIWVAAEPAQLPAVCRTFVDVTGAVASIGFVRHGITVRDVAVEALPREDVAGLGRQLAPLTDVGAATTDDTDLPRTVSMVSLLGAELTLDAEAVVDRWRQNQSIHERSGSPSTRPAKRAGTLRALVGQSGADAMHLDLRAQGPHALVGGTTGSGKSEFLQTWALAMAAEYSPDRVTFLFVDYKGGAAFAECTALPHCVGLVTDLSPHLVRRALTSLRAELRRREGILNHKKAKDILELEKRGDPECPPALVLMIDEFAALVGEVPEFVDGVVDIAQRGRSLGINLIMATQRPAGVIKDNLRANTNLRIALRVADEADSSDVVGAPVAAAFDAAIPGRAIAKIGPGRLVPFQAAYSGGWTTNEPPAASIVVRDLRFGTADEWPKPLPAESPIDPGPTDLALAVRTIAAAATDADIRKPRRPWLNELSRTYDLAALGPRTDTALLIGVVDRPEQQLQTTQFFHPDTDGNLAIYGTSGSGKTVLLRTLAVSAGITPRGGPVHVYGMDFAAGGLRMLEVLPHVGSIIGGDDAERVVRLLSQLKTLADERARTFSDARASNITEYRTLSGRADEPRILLLVDGLPAFRAEYEAAAGPRAAAFATLQQLISEGRKLGIHVAFTADRPAAVPGAIASSVPRRVVLRMAEDSMYLLLDVPGDVLGPTSPPGRALVDGLETQVAVLGGSTNAADQFDALNRLAQAIGEQRSVIAPAVRAMPALVTFDELPSSIGGRPVLGIGETDLEPCSFVDDGVLLVGGGPGSGRSNALAALVEAIRRAQPARPLYYLGHRRSELATREFWEAMATTPDAVADLAKRLLDDLSVDGARTSAVVIESIADFQGTPADAAIVALVRMARRSAHLVVAESETQTWNSSFPMFAEIKAARRGLLLQPETIEGDTILKTSFPRVSRGEFPPGRGMYASGGKAVRVQVPIASHPDATERG